MTAASLSLSSSSAALASLLPSAVPGRTENRGTPSPCRVEDRMKFLGRIEDRMAFPGRIENRVAFPGRTEI